MSSSGDSLPDPECERERPYVHMSPWTLCFSPALEEAYCNAMTQGSGAVRKGRSDVVASLLCTLFWTLAVAACYSRHEPWKGGVCAVAGLAAAMPGLLQLQGNRSGKKRDLAWFMARVLLSTSTVLADVPASIAHWDPAPGAGVRAQPQAGALLLNPLLHLCVPAVIPLRFFVHALMTGPLLLSAVTMDQRVCAAVTTSPGVARVELAFQAIHPLLGTTPLVPGTGGECDAGLRGHAARLGLALDPTAAAHLRLVMCLRGGVWLLVVTNLASTTALFVAELRSRTQFVVEQGSRLDAWPGKIRPLFLGLAVLWAASFAWKLLELVYV